MPVSSELYDALAGRTQDALSRNLDQLSGHRDRSSATEDPAQRISKYLDHCSEVATTGRLVDLEGNETDWERDFE
jgi:hypothetical protein